MPVTLFEAEGGGRALLGASRIDGWDNYDCRNR